MLQQVAFLLAGLTPVLALASPITVGGVPVEMPNPEGFVAVTDDMTELATLQRRFVAPGNKQFVTFIPHEAASNARQGGLPDFVRRFSVQTAIDIADLDVAAADFRQLQRTIREQNEEIFASNQAEMKAVMQDINKGLSEDLGQELNLSMGEAVPLPPHRETDRTIAYSMITRFGINDASGQPTNMLVAATTTVAHVKNRILFFYTYADADSLTWTREASEQWVDKVLTANPVTHKFRISTLWNRFATRIDWAQVLGSAGAGGLLALAVSLVRARRRRSNDG